MSGGCTSSSAAKYLYKYVYKGHNRATIVVRQAAQDGAQAGDLPVPEVDKIIDFIDGRYVYTSEPS
jgi:hypothetical protein